MAWIDEEWPATARNAVGKLWGMYHAHNHARIDERIENAKLVQELTQEKQNLQKKADDMVKEVNRFIDETCKTARQENYTKIQESSREKEQMQLALHLLEKEVGELKSKNKECEDEKAVLKEEKKKLEYMLFDLLKISNANKEKLKKIKEICDE